MVKFKVYLYEYEWPIKCKTMQNALITMNRAEAVSPSMSLSSELSDSPLLSATHKSEHQIKQEGE